MPRAWRIVLLESPAMAASNCEQTRWLPGSATPARGCNGVAIPHTRCHGHRSPRVVQAHVDPPPLRLVSGHGTAALRLRPSCKSVQKQTQRDRLRKQPPASEQWNLHRPHVFSGVAVLLDISARAASSASPAGTGSDSPRAKCTAAICVEVPHCHTELHAAEGK